jgi:hypothetical protein
MPIEHRVAVYGAYGHTGRFVVAELRRRGWGMVLSGRDETKLRALSVPDPGARVLPAAITDPGTLDELMVGVDAVINCAGPFAFTQEPLIEAAIRAGVHYLDVAAEPDIVERAIRHHADAVAAGVVVSPANAFYGGLGDLIASASAREWTSVDDVRIAYWLSSWIPTPGTLATIDTASTRRQGQRLVWTPAGLELRSDEAPAGRWEFPGPIGTQEVTQDFVTADAVTILHHLPVTRLQECMSIEALNDLGQLDGPGPLAVDERGRSAQRFMVDVQVAKGGVLRRSTAVGRDIYAVSGPLVVEAAARLLDGPPRTGVITAGAMAEPSAFLDALAPDHLQWSRAA